jgi:hypothetical protein
MSEPKARFTELDEFEKALVDHVYQGDVDHYRPKALFPELA